MITSDDKPEATRRGMWSQIPADGSGAVDVDDCPPWAADRVVREIDPIEAESVARQSKAQQFRTEVNALCIDLAKLLVSKNTDYSSKNIAESPGGALNGLNVRLWDKSCRLRNLIETGATPEHESLRDTLRDLAGYAVIGLMCLDGTWPGVAP